MPKDWRRELAERFPRARFGEPLSRHTTFRIGGPADCYLELRTREELRELMGLCRARKVPVFFLGWGSNLLVRDGGLRGVAARLRGDFEKIDFLEGRRVRAGAGVRIPQLVVACARRGLSGGEPLVGVPGTVGGALVMNAGTREGEIGDLVREVEILDARRLAFRTLKRRALKFDYRSSNLSNSIVASCVLELKAGDKVDIIRRVRNLQQRRLATQPIHTYNVGSTFKNPPGLFVAKLIEEAGLKGAARGGARISPKHANFIENVSAATAADVLELVRLARQKVRAALGINLELEMKVVGEP